MYLQIKKIAITIFLVYSSSFSMLSIKQRPIQPILPDVSSTSFEAMQHSFFTRLASEKNNEHKVWMVKQYMIVKKWELQALENEYKDLKLKVMGLSTDWTKLEKSFVLLPSNIFQEEREIGIRTASDERETLTTSLEKINPILKSIINLQKKLSWLIKKAKHEEYRPEFFGLLLEAAHESVKSLEDNCDTLRKINLMYLKKANSLYNIIEQQTKIITPDKLNHMIHLTIIPHKETATQDEQDEEEEVCFNKQRLHKTVDKYMAFIDSQLELIRSTKHSNLQKSLIRWQGHKKKLQTIEKLMNTISYEEKELFLNQVIKESCKKLVELRQYMEEIGQTISLDTDPSILHQRLAKLRCLRNQVIKAQKRMEKITKVRPLPGSIQHDWDDASNFLHQALHGQTISDLFRHIGERIEELKQRCPICSKHASQCCSRCKQVYYCSKKHQLEHRKKHRDNCTYFIVEPKEDQSDDDEIFCVKDHKGQLYQITKDLMLQSPDGEIAELNFDHKGLPVYEKKTGTQSFIYFCDDIATLMTAIYMDQDEIRNGIMTSNRTYHNLRLQK